MHKLYQITDTKILKFKNFSQYYVVGNIITFYDGKKLNVNYLNQILINGDLGLVAFSNNFIMAIAMKLKIKNTWKKLKNNYKNKTEKSILN